MSKSSNFKKNKHTISKLIQRRRGEKKKGRGEQTRKKGEFQIGKQNNKNPNFFGSFQLVKTFLFCCCLVLFFLSIIAI